MSVRTHILGFWLSAGFLLPAAQAHAIALPPSCAAPKTPAASNVSLAKLRRRLAEVNETDPDAAIQLMCDTIPRVAHEKGEHSADLAWWVASLATPLIAYKDRFQEAIPLLQFAEPILARQPKKYAAEIADINVAYAWISLRQGRLAESADAWQKALNARERAPGLQQIELQKVLVGLAQVRASLRDFPAARAAVARANGILLANHATVSEAGAAIENIEANLDLREEDYERARAHAEAQIAIEKQLQGGAPQLVTAYVLLGSIDQRRDDFDAAEAALREAIRLSESEKGPLQRHYLVALNQIASMLIERDRPFEALPFAQRALEVGESTLGKDAPKLVGVLRTLAEASRALGDLPAALHLYQRAELIAEQSRADVERQVLVAHYRGFGNLQLELGDLRAARAALNAGIDAADEDSTLTVERGYLLLALARATDASDPDRARRLEQALALFQSRLPKAHPVNLRVVNELCAVEIAAHAEPAPHCKEAADWVSSARDVEPTLRSAVYQNESAWDEVRGDLDGAYAQALKSLAAAEAVGTPDPLWRAYFTFAAANATRRDTTLAIFFGKQAVSQIERLRGDFTRSDRDLQRTFLIDKVSVYRAVADWLMEVGRIDEGLEVLKLLKGQEFYDFQSRGAASSTDVHVDFTREEQALRERYAEALTAAGERGEEFERLSRLLEADRLTPAEHARLEQMLRNDVSLDEARRTQIQAVLASGQKTRAPSEVRQHSLQAAGLSNELRQAGPDAALAVFLLTQNHLRVLVATAKQQLEYQVPVDAADLQKQIGHFLEALNQRSDVTASSRALYATLAKPLDAAAQAAHAKRLVLWLDGALRYVPFAALNDGSRYLIEKYALQIYSVPAHRSGAIAENPSHLLKVRGLGVAQAVPGFDALPAMADELCDVVRGPITGLTQRGSACTAMSVGNGALPGLGFADAAFTEARFKSVLQDTSDYSILHIGTHFSLRPGNVMLSFLVLGDGSRLSLDAISKLSFSGIDLVTLSACQTALGGAVSDDGREIEGLNVIVQRAGARQVIASLWQVEDKSTALLMRQLYGHLARAGVDGARALQQSQLELLTMNIGGRRPYEQPFYWAGFVASQQ
ncbi:MAG TPA: CHAT domain-containing protein [Steroidobacteraceae bacterium]|nr:CHAT domain-containing protein [Steroidobacteraceae bacterium]